MIWFVQFRDVMYIKVVYAVGDIQMEHGNLRVASIIDIVEELI